MPRSPGWRAVALGVLLLLTLPPLALAAGAPPPQPVFAALAGTLGDLWQALWSLLGPDTAGDRGHGMDPDGLIVDSGHGMDPDCLDTDRGHEMDPNG